MTDKKIKLEKSRCALCGSDEWRRVARGYDYEYWTSDTEFSAVQCEKCAHIYLNPRPTMDSSPLIYPSDYYTLTGRHTSGASHLISIMKKRVVRRRLSFCGKTLEKKSANILEVGCGDCSLLLNIKHDYPSSQASGIDLKVAEEIKKKCGEEGISIIEGNVEDIDLPEEAFDIIIMNQVIEHLWDPRGALEKLSSSLKSDGVISIETVNVDGYDRGFFRAGFWGAYYFPRHINFFSFKSLKILLEETGFKVVKQYSLLAPVIWAFSFHALTSRTKDKRFRFPGRFFSDRNPLCMAIFTLVDSLAVLMGLKTSNQKTIARKADKPGSYYT